MTWFQLLASFALAALFSIALTPLVSRLARRLGKVAAPKADRWHQKPTPLLGGIAIFFSFIAGIATFGTFPTPVLGLLSGAAILFVLGLVDDLRELPPQAKLAGQIVAAAVAVVSGVHLETGLGTFVDYGLSALWLVGIANALNLLDNMDGVAAGTAAITALGMGIFAAITSSGSVAVIALALSGAAAGFLVYNFNPARIFMGDVGSLFIGFTLAGVSLLIIKPDTLAVPGLWHLVLPIVFLAVPVADTALVIADRYLGGRPISQGGRDHMSHRLVAIGLTERGTTLVLYFASIAFGVLAISAELFPHPQTAMVGALAVIALLSFWSFLGDVAIDSALDVTERERKLAKRQRVKAWLRRLLEIAGDMLAVGAAYLSAYLLRWDFSIPPDQQVLFMQSLPIVLASFLIATFSMKLYQVLPRYVSMLDAWRVSLAAMLGAGISIIAITFTTNFGGYSRYVFVLLAILAVITMSASRVALRAFMSLFRRAAGRENVKRVLIYGAGDGGDLAYRYLMAETRTRYKVVGFLDDDSSKHGWLMHGVKVIGSMDVLRGSQNGRAPAFDEVVVAVPSAPDTRRVEIHSELAQLGVASKRLQSPIVEA